MKRTGLVLLVILVALPLAAADYEKLLLPVAPSVVYCALHSKYDTRLVVYNASGNAIDKFCTDDSCSGLAADTGTVVLGNHVPVPIPRFIHVPKELVSDMEMTLVVESSELTQPEARSYTELPVVRESDFREGKIQIVGVRMDDGFRKTLRLYGLDGSTPTAVRVRVFDLTSSTPAYEHEYSLMPQAGLDANGMQISPTFNMECDLSDYVGNYEHPVRVEIESMTPGQRIWGFVSVTNNVTQHFYTVVPR
ncbi:MAG TPA: hypothetical protein VF608_04990 [Thermoanaerobaculia bacterium]